MTGDRVLSDQFDAVVVGGGPGGYAAALYGASAGLRMALVERDRVGGTCLHAGCIPAKALLETATSMRDARHMADFGVGVGEPVLDLTAAHERKNRIVTTLFEGLSKLLKHRKVTVIPGSGSLGADGSVLVDGGGSGTLELGAGHVVIATGSVPRHIPGIEVDGHHIVDSDGLLALDRLPGSAVVIGGGAIGCEFASMLGDMGVDVTVLELAERILPGCDDDITRTLIRSFAARGITVRTGVQVDTCEVVESGAAGSDRDRMRVHVHLQAGDDGDSERIVTELVVVAVGRAPQTAGLDLGVAGVEGDERGYVRVDERCRTTRERVYAIGDVIATPALAHVAFAEAICAVRDILGEESEPVDHSKVPWCIYSHPEVAFAGLSERAARDAGIDVVVSKHRYGGNSRALIMGEPDGLAKVIAAKAPDGRAGRVLGVQMVGPMVTEQLGQGYLALNAGLDVEDVARFTQPHPTLGEIFGEGLMSLTGRSLHG